MVLARTAVLVVELDAGRGAMDGPLEFVGVLAGFFSLALEIGALLTGVTGVACWLRRGLFGAGAEVGVGFVVVVGDGASFLGGRTCTRRWGATAVCGLAGAGAAAA